MELLIIILNREAYLETILSILVELEVSGATILESEGLGHFLAYEVPIFAGLRHLVGERKAENKLILGLVEDKEFFSKFKKMLSDENIDFKEAGTGVVMMLPVSQAITGEEVV